MAYTSTTLFKSVFGSVRVVGLKVTTDGVSGAVACPTIGVVFGAQLSPISMMSFTGPVVKINTDATSAAANGKVMISNVTSGDDIFLMVYGRS